MEHFKCAFAKHCSGCQLQNLQYQEQLMLKQKRLERLFSELQQPAPVIGMERPLPYRNKSQFSFLQKTKKETCFGIYQSKTKSVTPITACQLDDPRADTIAATVSKLIQSFKLSVYDYHKQSGFVRHLLVRIGHYSGEVMVTLVCSSELFPKKKQFVSALVGRHPEITTVTLSVCKSEKMRIGKEQEVLFGPGHIMDTMLGKRFFISPASFYQVNTIQAERLYQYGLHAAQLRSTDFVLDAYCGTGTIGLLAAGAVQQVVGIEKSRSAVGDAVRNASVNHISNAAFICADATEFMTRLCGEQKRPDVIILDPPRAGSTMACLKAIAQLAPRTVLYISCNPETQRRDAAVLLRQGYNVSCIQGFDLFPMTKHCECVMVLNRTEQPQQPADRSN